MGFNVIDQVIVGLLGADAVAAVGLSNSIASIALLVYASAGVGAGVMVARAFGRKDLKEVSQIASTGQGLSGLLGLITAFLLISFSQPLLRLVGADPKLAGSANGYFQLYAGSIAPMILSAVTSAVFRSLNAPRTPLIITSAAVALNTVLGFVLVLGFGPIPSFGVIGAGWATLISQSGRCFGVDPISLCRQKGRTLGLATARFEGRHHSGQAPALDRADCDFRGALGHEHLHLRGGVHPAGHHEASS
jgi:Na+-driven multidrug efflux pump